MLDLLIQCALFHINLFVLCDCATMKRRDCITLTMLKKIVCQKVPWLVLKRMWCDTFDSWCSSVPACMPVLNNPASYRESPACG